MKQQTVTKAHTPLVVGEGHGGEALPFPHRVPPPPPPHIYMCGLHIHLGIKTYLPSCTWLKDYVCFFRMSIEGALVSCVHEGLTHFLSLVYGDMVSLGDGKLSAAPDGCLMLLCEACTVSLQAAVLTFEWATWVDPHSSHARLVWRSRFPGLLHKSVWYALDLASFTAQVCSVMWGVGYRGYPRGGWVGVLHRFWRIQRLDHVQPLPMLYRNER